MVAFNEPPEYNVVPSNAIRDGESLKNFEINLETGAQTLKYDFDRKVIFENNKVGIFKEYTRFDRLDALLKA
jgi:hypothetical protein